jgi:hypothetical protein
MKPEITALQIETAVSEETQAWQRPVITRVDIKRTLQSAGSATDDGHSAQRII